MPSKATITAAMRKKWQKQIHEYRRLCQTGCTLSSRKVRGIRRLKRHANARKELIDVSDRLIQLQPSLVTPSIRREYHRKLMAVHSIDYIRSVLEDDKALSAQMSHLDMEREVYLDSIRASQSMSILDKIECLKVLAVETEPYLDLLMVEANLLDEY